MAKPILRVNVDLSSHTVPLILHEGDDPEFTVKEFANNHNLDDNTVSYITEHINQSLLNLSVKEAPPHCTNQNPYPTDSQRPKSEFLATSMQSFRGRGGRLWSGGRKPPPSLTGSFFSSPAKSLPSFRHTTPTAGPSGLLGAVVAKEQPPSVRHRATATQPPPHRVLSEKLYEDAAWIQQRRELMRQRAEYLKTQSEMEEVTFRPLISRHARETGLSKVGKEETFGKAIDLQIKRLAKQQDELKECTFKPKLHARRSQGRGQKVFLELYEEAHKRQERQDDVKQTEGRVLTVDETAKLVMRLTVSKSCPNTPTMANSLPKSSSNSVAKGHALYAAAMEKKKQKEKLIEAIKKAEKKNPEICSTSKAILEERKRRVFQRLFDVLAEGEIIMTPGVCDRKLADVLDPRLRDLVRPIVEFISQQNFPITFDRFVAALEVRLAQAAGPTASLFVSSTEAGDSRRRTRSQEIDFRPQLSARSNLRRDTNIPLHEALWKSHEAKEAKLLRLREEKRQFEISECTFRPCLAKTSKKFSDN